MLAFLFSPLTKSVCSSAASRRQDLNCSNLIVIPGLLSAQPGIHGQSLLWFLIKNSQLPGLSSAYALWFTPLCWSSSLHSLLHSRDDYILTNDSDSTKRAGSWQLLRLLVLFFRSIILGTFLSCFPLLAVSDLTSLL